MKAPERPAGWAECAGWVLAAAALCGMSFVLGFVDVGINLDDFPPIELGLMPLGLGLLAAGFFVSLLPVKRRLLKGWKMVAGILAAGLAFCGVIQAALQIGASQEKRFTADAAEIVAAAERFQAERGIPPAALDDLVPVYLPTKPRPPHGVRGGDYRLFFEPTKNSFKVWSYEGLMVSREYDSGTRQWTYRD